MTTRLADARQSDEIIFVASRLFGPLHLQRADLIVMPQGMLGFAGERRFVLLPATADRIFWLQSVDEGGLIFLLADPFLFFPEYEVDAPEIPEPAEGEEVVVLAIVTLPRGESEACTVNLLAPIVIRHPGREARQVVLAGQRYHTKHRIDLRSRLG